MKKSILIALFGAGAVVAANAQGLVNFNNYYISGQVTGISYANGLGAGSYVGPEISLELYYGLSTDTLISQMTALPGSIIAAGLGAASGPGALGGGAGWFDAGAVFVPNISGTAVAGGTYTFAIVASGTYAPFAGPGGNGIFTGSSAIFTGTTAATSSMPTPNLPDGLRLGSFTVSETIAPVPEPSSLALAGLGGFGMLMAFRRKKA